MTPEALTPVLAISGLVLLVAVAAVRLSVQSGLPSLLIYLGIGMAMGEAGAGIQFSDMAVADALSYLALVLILAEGGLTTSWPDIRDSIKPAAMLSTVGVGVSALVVGVAAHFVFGTDWVTSVLLGAILASTDAAAVFSVLRTVPLPHRLTGILEAESGFNDAPVVLLVVALSAQAGGHSGHAGWQGVLAIIGHIVLELAIGALVGVALGWVGARLLRSMATASSGLFPIGMLACVIAAYGCAALAHGSGFLATYLCALVLGNSGLPHRAAYRGFAQGLGWLAQIGLFVMLGLLVSPGKLLPQVGQAVIIGLVLLLVARPLSVIASTAWFGLSWREQLFLSWAGLRGAVPIVLATVPVLAGVRDIEWIFNLVFVLVVIYTLLQAPLMPRVARGLGVTDPERAMDLDVEASPLEEFGADLLQVRIGGESLLHGIELFELRLPPGAEVTLIVRDGAAFVPAPSTVLRGGDQLLIVATPGSRRQAEQRLQSVDRGGRLAGWSAANPRIRTAPATARRPAQRRGSGADSPVGSGVDPAVGSRPGEGTVGRRREPQVGAAGRAREPR